MHETNKMWTQFGIIYTKFGHGQLFVKREGEREHILLQPTGTAKCNRKMLPFVII